MLSPGLAAMMGRSAIVEDASPQLPLLGWETWIQASTTMMASVTMTTSKICDNDDFYGLKLGILVFFLQECGFKDLGDILQMGK